MSALGALATAGKEQAARLSPWIAVAIGFSIPISTALDNLLVALLLLAWLAGGGFGRKLEAVRANRFAVVACALFLLHLAGTLYSEGSRMEVLYALDKAAPLLLIPLLISLQPAERFRRHALTALLAAITLTLVLSYAFWLGVLPEGAHFKGVRSDPVIFKLHITHSVLAALGAFLFALKASAAPDVRSKLLWGLGAGLAGFNVLFMVHGRTGQLILVALALYGLFSWLRWRAVIPAALAGLAVAGVGYFAPSSSLHYRMQNTIAELQDWRAGKPAQPSNMRPESWRNSIEIVRSNPLIGTGTGGFAAAYRNQVAGTSMAAVTHPENQYLYYAVQFGLAGLAAMVAAFVYQWCLAARLATSADRRAGRGLIIAIAVGCLFNSFLLDHTESLLYAWLSGILFSGLRPPGHASAA